MEEVAKRDKGEVGELNLGQGGVVLGSVAGNQRASGLGGEPEAGEGFEGFVDQDMGELVGLAGGQGEGGIA